MSAYYCIGFAASQGWLGVQICLGGEMFGTLSLIRILGFQMENSQYNLVRTAHPTSDRPSYVHMILANIFVWNCLEGARIVREIRVAVVTRGTVLVKNRFDRVLGKLLCCCFIEDFDQAIISKRTFNIIFFLLFFVNHYFKYILLKT
jgi:hypothetical protein